MTQIVITVDGQDGISVSAPETGDIERKTAQLIAVIDELKENICKIGLGNYVDPLKEKICKINLDPMFDAVRDEICNIMRS